MAARDWKFESVTYGLTWVGARDTCVSKNKVIVLHFVKIYIVAAF